jgi:hypothetical protein
MGGAQPMRRALVLLLVLVAFGAGGAAAVAAFTATTSNPGNSFTAAATFGGMKVATGTYTGNNNDNRAIAVAFQPDVVIVKGDRAEYAVVRTSSMAGDASKAGAALAPDLVQQLTATGFQIGRDPAVNRNGTRYDWIAFKTYANQMNVGSYTGNGTTQSIGSMGFSPDYVMVLSAGADAPIQRSRTMGSTFRFDEGAAAANGVTSLDSNGFSVGNSTEANVNTRTYHYVAWNEVHGLMQESSYVGNGGDNRNVGGATFQPEYVMVRSSTNGNICDRGVHRPASLVGDASLYFTNLANTTNVIQALQATGFQVGNDCKVNTNLKTYYWMGFRTGS